jgi:hypothetical protein
VRVSVEFKRADRARALPFFGFLARPLHIPAALQQFWADGRFLSVFLSHLFERNLQSFVLPQLEMALSQAVAGESLSMTLIACIGAVARVLPSVDGFPVEAALFQTINQTKASSACAATSGPICEQFPRFDDSRATRELLFAVVVFLTGVSQSQPLPDSTFAALEFPLSKFRSPGDVFSVIHLESANKTTSQRLQRLPI